MARFTIGDVGDFLISSERNGFDLLHDYIMKLIKKNLLLLKRPHNVA